jgi:uncharacterized protein YlxW (UPF0749 family)
MLFKKKKTAPEQNGEVQFEKNIKTLWIYTTLFCLFALVLIVISSVIQGKINAKAEDYYEDIYTEQINSSKSTIQNIQTENQSLKSAIEMYKAENDMLVSQQTADAALVQEQTELITNAEYLLLAQKAANSGKRKEAKEFLEKINKEKLTDTMLELYISLTK